MSEATEIVQEAATMTPQTISVAGARPEIVTGSGDELKLILGEFAGPLALLLYLIRQEQVSIYDIPIARITDVYLSYLRVMQGMDITVASDFLVMAATLIEIKSRMLLPRDPAMSEEELEELDPRRELVERLLEHQKYKAAAEMLWSRATVEQAGYTRAPLETDKENPEGAAARARPAARLPPQTRAPKGRGLKGDRARGGLDGRDARTPPQHDLLGGRVEPARLLRARRDPARTRARLPLRPRTRPHDRDQAFPAPDLRRHHRARQRLKTYKPR